MKVISNYGIGMRDQLPLLKLQLFLLISSQKINLQPQTHFGNPKRKEEEGKKAPYLES